VHSLSPVRSPILRTVGWRRDLVLLWLKPIPSRSPGSVERIVPIFGIEHDLSVGGAYEAIGWAKTPGIAEAALPDENLNLLTYQCHAFDLDVRLDRVAVSPDSTGCRGGGRARPGERRLGVRPEAVGRARARPARTRVTPAGPDGRPGGYRRSGGRLAAHPRSTRPGCSRPGCRSG
jgi:hypothetical protein